MLIGEHQSGQGVIKINCRPLDQSELKKFDKNEKIQFLVLGTVFKGKNKFH